MTQHRKSIWVIGLALQYDDLIWSLTIGKLPMWRSSTHLAYGFIDIEDER